MKFLPALILTIAGLAWHPNAHALACGDTITEDTVLAGDLSCTGGAYALYVATPGITIDFNGYTVSGPETMDGVRVANASDVTLLFGNFTGFRVAINATRADRLTVNGNLMFELGSGVIASDSREVVIVGNSTHSVERWGFFLAAYRGSRPSLGGHLIAGNFMVGPPTLVGVCGYANARNQIINNELYGGGVRLLDGAGRTEVSGNIMEGGGVPAPGVQLHGSRHNLVRDNIVFDYNQGISLVPTYTGTCVTGPLPLPQVSHNQIISNDIFFGQTAIVLGNGNGNRRLPLVFHNLIRDNTIASFDLGLYLRADSFHNTASGNLFFNTLFSLRNEGLLNRISDPGSPKLPGQSRISVKYATGALPSVVEARAHALRSRPAGKNRSQPLRPVAQPRIGRRAN